MHPTAAEIGYLVMQITVFGSASTEDVIITESVVVIDRQDSALFNLFSQNGVGFQSERVGREVGKVHLEEKVEVAVPLVGIGGGHAIDEIDADVAEAGLLGPVNALKGML